MIIIILLIVLIIFTIKISSILILFLHFCMSFYSVWRFVSESEYSNCRLQMNIPTKDLFNLINITSSILFSSFRFFYERQHSILAFH